MKGLITPIAIFPGLVSVEGDASVGEEIDEVLAGAVVKKVEFADDEVGNLISEAELKSGVVVAAKVAFGKLTSPVAPFWQLVAPR